MNLCTQGFPILSKNLQEKTKIDNVYNDRAQSEYILEADETMVQIAKKASHYTKFTFYSEISTEYISHYYSFVCQ